MGRIIMLSLCICLAALNAGAQGKGHGKGHQKKSVGSPAVAVNVTFGTSDIELIQQYYRAHSASLPPGLQKKLDRGKPLPPGWQKKLRPFPPDVAVRLVSTCGTCGRGVIGGYGVIYDKKTAIILDIVQLVADIAR